MLKLFTILTFIVAGLVNPAFAGEKHQQIGQLLYPNNQEDQQFIAKFFEIVELHKTEDPLLEGKGPSVSSYSLDTIKFAFMNNMTETTTDLVFFHWNLPLFTGLEKHDDLSKVYGSDVFVLKAVEKKLIATQGENNDTLSNFSYLFGDTYIASQIRLGNPTMDVPDQVANWKPHPDAMDADHPLRKTLGDHALTLLSPNKDLLLSAFGFDEKTLPIYEAKVKEDGGFVNLIMGMMIHEMYHVKEFEDAVLKLAKRRDIPESRDKLIEKLKIDTQLKDLFATYAKIVFSLGDSLKNEKSAKEMDQLSDLMIIASQIKTNYPNAWAFIWGYEYTEGFAEYVSAYSMIQANVTSLAEQIDLQKRDQNNFAYRTGTIGGLYLAKRLKTMPFDNNQDHRQSLWELIFERTNPPAKEISIRDIQVKYKDVSFDAETEINLVIEYLVSTVVDL